MNAQRHLVVERARLRHCCFPSGSRSPFERVDEALSHAVRLRTANGRVHRARCPRTSPTQAFRDTYPPSPRFRQPRMNEGPHSFEFFIDLSTERFHIRRPLLLSKIHNGLASAWGRDACRGAHLLLRRPSMDIRSLKCQIYRCSYGHIYI